MEVIVYILIVLPGWLIYKAASKARDKKAKADIDKG